MPHRFNVEWPAQTETFLFQGLDERAVAAEILREEDGCHVLAVEYERRPAQEGLMVHKSPVLFWVDGRNRMVMRLAGETGHRMPTEDEVTWSRHRMVVREMHVNEPLMDRTFHFTPPEDAEPETGGGCGIAFGGGGGFVQAGPDEKHRLEYQNSHKWQGETLVDRSRWKLLGMLLTFERRLTFSEDGADLRVAERVTSPKGEAETSCTLPVG